MTKPSMTRGGQALGLAERWPTMTAREKDAELAKARGWTSVRVSRDGRFCFGFPPDHEGDRQLVPQVPRCDTWTEAGKLLEELASLFPDGMMLQAQGEKAWWLFAAYKDGPPLPPLSAESKSPIDTIALAYCLAKKAASSISKP